MAFRDLLASCGRGAVPLALWTLFALVAPASASPLSVTSCFCALSSNAELFEAIVPPVVLHDPKSAAFTTGPWFVQSDVATERDLTALGRAQVDVSIGSSVLTASAHSSLSLSRPAAVSDGSSTDASGAATGRWTFDVLVDSLFTLDGLVDTETVQTGIVNLLQATNVIQLLRLDVPTVVLFSTLSDDEAFSVSGVLPAGTYRLMTEAKVDARTRFAGSAQADSRYEFSLQLTPLAVPEPAGTGLVALALVLLGAVGKRRHPSHG